jgi:hypothetical protein
MKGFFHLKNKKNPSNVRYYFGVAGYHFRTSCFMVFIEQWYQLPHDLGRGVIRTVRRGLLDFKKATTLCIPRRDSISRPIAPVSLVAGGDDTTIPRRQGKWPFSFYGRSWTPLKKSCRCTLSLHAKNVVSKIQSKSLISGICILYHPTEAESGGIYQIICVGFPFIYRV